MPNNSNIVYVLRSERFPDRSGMLTIATIPETVDSRMESAMTRSELIDEIRKLTDKQFVEFFYDAVTERNIYSGDGGLWESHLILANAVRERENGQTWTVELICYTPGDDWPDDSLLCQSGIHCGLPTMSWAKKAQCPVCNGEVFGS